MKVQTGEIKLIRLLELVKQILDDSIYSDLDINIEPDEKLKFEYIKKITEKGIFINARKGAFSVSDLAADLELIADDIVYIANARELLLFKYFPQNKYENIKIKWIAIEESDTPLKQAVIDSIELVNTLAYGQMTSSAKLAFAKIEQVCDKHIKNYTKRTVKHPTRNILEVPNAREKSVPIKQDNNLLTNISKKRLSSEFLKLKKKTKFQYHCPLCGYSENIIFEKNFIDPKYSNPSTKDIISFDIETKTIHFHCEHCAKSSATKEAALKLMMDAELFDFIIYHNRRYDIAFIYLFRTVAYVDGKSLTYTHNSSKQRNKLLSLYNGELS